MDVRGKAGSYGFCLGGGCNPYKADLATAGRILIPFMDPSHNINKKAYLYGDFVNDLVIPCAPGSGCPAEIKAGNMISAAVAEAARTTIRAALMGW